MCAGFKQVKEHFLNPRWGVAVLCVVVFSLMFSQAGHFLAENSEQPVQADLIVAIGGDNGSRIEKTVELYQAGFASHVLLTGIEGGSAEPRSFYLNWRARYLVEHGVTKSALMFDADASNSWEEAVDTLRLMKERNWQQALVVSEPPHFRRLAFVWSKVFDGSGKEYRLIAAQMEGWDASNWWKNEKSAQYVVTELIKLVYYTVAH